MVPVSLYSVFSFIILGDADGTSVLHLNVEMIHAFQLNVQSIDGNLNSCLRVFDMHGNQNFEITAEGSENLREWQRLCNQPNSSYQKRS